MSWIDVPAKPVNLKKGVRVSLRTPTRGGSWLSVTLYPDAAAAIELTGGDRCDVQMRDFEGASQLRIDYNPSGAFEMRQPARGTGLGLALRSINARDTFKATDCPWVVEDGALLVKLPVRFEVAS